MNSKNLLIGVAVAGLCLVGGCASKSTSTAAGKCYGVNACKGHGDCGGKGHACAGKNKCKGKGFKKMSKDYCSTKGGRFVSSVSEKL